jgi:hypothetical protein
VFKEKDGPTALRRELVQALSLSRSLAVIEAADGAEHCCAGLVAVWNGRKGFVAVLVRSLDGPRLQRWVYDNRLKDIDSVSTAVEAGMAFATSLGFDMDSPAFAELEAGEQGRRMDEWNDLRKLSRQPRASLESSAGADVSTTPITADEHGEAVLGRLSLVKRAGSANPLARLLSYF